MLGVPLFSGKVGWVGVVLTPTITPTKHPPLCDSMINRTDPQIDVFHRIKQGFLRLHGYSCNRNH